MLWISATANDRVGHTTPRPHGPNHTRCRDHWECGVWVFNSTNLISWERTLTDVDPKLGTPNTDIGRVYPSSAYPVPANLPAHRYVMATESGTPWIVNNNGDGDLRTGWVTLSSDRASGGSLACPSVRYLPSDGYYYTISGGSKIVLQRSRDLRHWVRASEVFVQPSPADVMVASTVMSSAADNLRRSHANLSFPFRALWDRDSNDADFCCESWGGASVDKGGPESSFVVWGADGQGASGFKAGPEGFAAIGTSALPLEKLLQSYF